MDKTKDFTVQEAATQYVIGRLISLPVAILEPTMGRLFEWTSKRASNISGRGREDEEIRLFQQSVKLAL